MQVDSSQPEKLEHVVCGGNQRSTVHLHEHSASRVNDSSLTVLRNEATVAVHYFVQAALTEIDFLWGHWNPNVRVDRAPARKARREPNSAAVGRSGQTRG